MIFYKIYRRRPDDDEVFLCSAVQDKNDAVWGVFLLSEEAERLGNGMHYYMVKAYGGE